MTVFGSQRLYEDARDGGFQSVGAGQQVGPGDPEEFPTVLPPTLDKIINGQDTAPMVDEWLASQEPERIDLDPPRTPKKPPPNRAGLKFGIRGRNRKERRQAAKEARRADKAAKKGFNYREILAIFAEICGIAALSAGFALIAPWCGLICLGLSLILVGMAISRDPGAS